MVRIRYTGGRSFYEVTLNRKPYYFTKENDRILDISDQTVVNYIFSLDNRAEFEVVINEPTVQPTRTVESSLQPEKATYKSTSKKKGRSKKGR